MVYVYQPYKQYNDKIIRSWFNNKFKLYKMSYYCQS